MTTKHRTVAALLLSCGLAAAPLLPAQAAEPGAAVASPSAPTGHCRQTLASYPTLEPGARRPAVRALQCALNALGRWPVAVDGYYGPQTRRAVHRIESGFEGPRAHPGRIDAGFWTLLFGRQLPSHRLAVGDHGPAVATLQRALRAAGADLVVDGDFGPQTRSVVRAYQRAHDYRPTGTMNRDVVFMLAMGGTF